VLIAGNWKMHKTPDEADAFLEAVIDRWTPSKGIEIALFPAFPALERCRRRLEGTDISLGAQNVHFESKGAFTGEVSCGMLTACGCRYALIGHSERRHVFGESDETIRRKLDAVLDADGLTPLLCVGEILDERKAGAARSRVLALLESALGGRDAEVIDGLVIAYEPVWAIGTGETATPDDAQEACGWIREAVAAEFGSETAAAIRILYGGSVKPGNATDLLDSRDIDGVLIGGASLEVDSFLAIASAARPA
jgi:triosephosphate isomerase